MAAKYPGLSLTSPPAKTIGTNTDFSCAMARLVPNFSHLELGEKEEAEKLQSFESRKQKVGQIEKGDIIHIEKPGFMLTALHRPTGFLMVKKIIRLEELPHTPKRVLEDLQMLDEVQSEFLVGFYGAYHADFKLSVFTEYMDGGCLEFLMNATGTFPEKAMVKITLGVLNGLAYLNDVHSMFHGNLKPRNILVNAKAQVKLSDCQAYKLLVHSKTKCRAETYMSPEGIEGELVSIATDIWALGVSLFELGTGELPIPLYFVGTSLGGKKMTKLLDYILNEPSPRLPVCEFSRDFEIFVNGCLNKNPVLRPALDFLVNHIWIRNWERKKFDFQTWVLERMEKAKKGNELSLSTDV